jgi:hypothetical protein
MSGNARTANKDPVSALLFTEGTSLFFPKPWGTVSNFYWDVVGYTPQTTGTWGGVTTFSVPNNVCTYFGKCYLKWDLSPQDGSSGSANVAGTSYRYDDFAGYAHWDSASLRYGSQIVDLLDSEFTKIKFYNEQMPEHKRDAIVDQVQGPLPAATRHLRLLNGMQCIVELPLFYTRGYSASMPLVLGSDLQWQIQWRQFPAVIDSDLGAAAYPAGGIPNINNQLLLLQQMYGASGILKLIDSQIKTTAVETGALATDRDIVIPTPNVNLPTTYQNIIVRKEDQFTPYRTRRWVLRGGLTDPEVRIFPGSVFWPTTSGNIRQPNLPAGLVKPYLSSIFRDTPVLTDPSIQMDISMQPQNANSSAGSLNTQFLAGYQVSVPITQVAGSSQLHIDVMSTTKTAVKQMQGNMYRVFQ